MVWTEEKPVPRKILFTETPLFALCQKHSLQTSEESCRYPNKNLASSKERWRKPIYSPKAICPSSSEEKSSFNSNFQENVFTDPHHLIQNKKPNKQDKLRHTVIHVNGNTDTSQSENSSSSTSETTSELTMTETEQYKSSSLPHQNISNIKLPLNESESKKYFTRRSLNSIEGDGVKTDSPPLKSNLKKLSLTKSEPKTNIVKKATFASPQTSVSDNHIPEVSDSYLVKDFEKLRKVTHQLKFDLCNQILESQEINQLVTKLQQQHGEIYQDAAKTNHYVERLHQSLTENKKIITDCKIETCINYGPKLLGLDFKISKVFCKYTDEIYKINDLFNTIFVQTIHRMDNVVKENRPRAETVMKKNSEIFNGPQKCFGLTTDKLEKTNAIESALKCRKYNDIVHNSVTLDHEPKHIIDKAFSVLKNKYENTSLPMFVH